MTRRHGTLVTWEDDRGFGFIEADGGGERVFVHIKSITETSTRPRTGARLSFAVGKGRDGRPAAVDVIVAGADPRQRESRRRGTPDAGRPPFSARRLLRLVSALLLLTLALLAVSLGRAPLALPGFYLGVGLISAFTYWRDKRAAEKGEWRVPEATLLGLDLIGGVVGGLLAQSLLRHKTSKPDFAIGSFAILAFHIGAMLVLITGVMSWP